MSTLERFRQFKPPGPVAAAFLQDRTSLVRAIRGPVGSGKTVSCVFDGLINASAMPVCTDGVIRFRDAIIGQTYGQIERNLYPTWFNWLPRDGGDWTEGEFTGGGGRFGVHKMTWDVLRDGQRVQVCYEAVFAAIGEQAVEAFMRGFEPTAFWLFEVDLLPATVLPTAITRLGRFPRRADVKGDAPYRSYVRCDLNAPDIDSWYYETFEVDRPKGYRQFVQPSGLSPQAENLQNLPRGYYERQVEALKNRKNLVKRFVKNEYAPSSDGEPVYDELFSDALHMAPEPLKPIPGVPIKLGLDQGVQRPAAIIAQQASSGQWRILDELVPGRTGASRFAQMLKRRLAEIAPGIPVELGWADPAGFDGADRENDEFAWAEIVSAGLGVPVLPAPSNELGLRLDAVREELTYMIDGTTPAILISPRCKMLRKGFASHYRYRRERVGGIVRTSDKPEKNDWSNPHDGLQYLLLGEKGRYGVIAAERSKVHARAAAGATSGTVIIRDGGF